MKRLLSLLLAIALLMGCYPTMLAQADTVDTLADAVAAAGANAQLQLQADSDENIVIDKNITIDLNGFDITGTVTVAPGAVLLVKDSQTDDYCVEDDAGYGKIAAVSGNVMGASGYLKIAEYDGFSFHKVAMTVTSVTLRSEVVGIYYNGQFRGDEVVAANVDTFGIALRLKKAPDAAYMQTSSACSRYDDFESGSQGNTASGTLLKNVMRKGRPKAENKYNAETQIYGAPYIRLNDGTYAFGSGNRYSLMKVMQEVDQQWEDLNATQKTAVKKLYDSFKTVTSGWYLPNINDEDDGDVDIPI